MRQKFCKFLLVALGAFILIHSLVPHHHHDDDLFINLSLEHEHAEGNAEEVGEQLFFSAVVEQDKLRNGFESGKLLLKSGTDFTSLSLPLQIRVSDGIITNNFCRLFGFLTVGGLRAPPAC